MLFGNVHRNLQEKHRGLDSNITLPRWMIAKGRADPLSPARHISRVEAWLADPQLLEPGADAGYAAVIEIDAA